MKQNSAALSLRHTTSHPKVRPLATLGLLAGFLLAAAVSWAGEGAFVLGNDALQLGRASSGVASPRSAYWSYFNPASIVELDRRMDVNWYTVRTSIELKPRGIIGNRFGEDFESDRFFNIPSGGVILPLETGTLGLGMYTPSGTGAEYGQSRNLLSRVLNADRRLYYQHMRLVLAYGYQFENGWAIGGGLHGSLSRFHSDHITLGLLPTAGDFEWDEALGAGFNVGVYKKWDRWAFGAAYSSRHWTQPFDKYRDLLRFSLDLPQILQAGIAYDLTPRIELTFDLKWNNWEGVRAYANDVLDGGFNWRDQFCVKAGIEYQLNEKTRLMAGASHGNSPITEDHVFVAGLVPVICENHLTAGLSRAINDQHEVHAAVIWGPPNTLRDTGRGDIFSILGRNSEITSGGLSGVVGYTWKF
jgi:long-subunit fatty acid transport protein